MFRFFTTNASADVVRPKLLWRRKYGLFVSLSEGDLTGGDLFATAMRLIGKSIDVDDRLKKNFGDGLRYLFGTVDISSDSILLRFSNLLLMLFTRPVSAAV